MATYAIGDVQGCFTELRMLLDKINYDSSQDQLWFCGDLINRGPESLATLRFIKELQPAPVVVLGNHDLHLLAIRSHHSKPKKSDTIVEILAAVDLHELCDWLQNQKLLHFDEKLDTTLIHGGLAPQWNMATARGCARELEEVLQSDEAEAFFKHMYSDQPNLWHPKLEDWSRLRFIANALTRLRYCNLEGELCLKEKGSPGKQSPDLFPWFAHPERAFSGHKVLFGHWASLGGQSHDPMYIALDTGCVWGGALSAYCIETEQKISVPAQDTYA